MLYLKSCPRCHGDVQSNRDLYGTYKGCLQCGHIVDVENPESVLSLKQISRLKKEVA